jgi:hypothetical protein
MEPDRDHDGNNLQLRLARSGQVAEFDLDNGCTLVEHGKGRTG